MDTFFASAERAAISELEKKVGIIILNPVIDALLSSVEGLVLVLDENRQLVAGNLGVLKKLGVSEPLSLLGLRPGELLECVHAKEEPNGCGTTRFCPSCGLAIAVVASLASGKVQERLCAVTVERDGKPIDLCLKAQATPIVLMKEKFVLVFIQDFTKEHAAHALERAFFHDISNLLTGIGAAVDLMALEHPAVDDFGMMQDLVERLTREVDIQRAIQNSQRSSYKTMPEDVSMRATVKSLESLFATHPVAQAKRLVISSPLPQVHLRTDRPLLVRILTNMLTNAFEASKTGEDVELDVAVRDGEVCIGVWNRGVIAEEAALRVFQKHFTTKSGPGRGVGTYSMRLFAEQLGGHVTFSSSEEWGTHFELVLPLG